MTEQAGRPDLALELAELTVRVARTIRRAGSAALVPIGITFGQSRLVRHLANHGPLRMADIATRMDVVPRSATDLVDALERLELVCRQPDPADRRSVLVGLTAAGADLVRRMDAARGAAAADIFGRLSLAEQRHLHALLDAVVGEHGGDR